jgi:hypothetical protein
MRSWVMVCRGVAGLSPNGPTAQDMNGKFLKAFDPDAHNGRGWAEWTSQRHLARRWNSPGEVLEFWRTVAKEHPVRADGKPNRPLTAFTIEPMQVEP